MPDDATSFETKHERTNGIHCTTKTVAYGYSCLLSLTSMAPLNSLVVATRRGLVYAVAIAGLAASAPNCQAASGDDERSALQASPEQMSMSPSSPIFVLRPNQNLEIGYDARTRTPIYVIERLDGVRGKAGGDPASRRNHRFRQEPLLPVEFRSRDGQYRNSGYDRGHLAPAADFSHDQDLMRDTFALTNVVPQVRSMNSGPWAQLEQWVRAVADKEWNESASTTYVVSGPLWLPTSYDTMPGGNKIFQYQFHAIGTPPFLVSVPTHLYKVVAVVNDKDEIARFAVFVMPNQQMSKGKVDLDSFLVQWTDLESVVGMKFFPSLTGRNNFRTQADALTRDQWSDAKSSGAKPLLLTDGEVKPSKSFAKRKGLRHLCSNGACRR